MTEQEILENAPNGAEYISEVGFLWNDDGSWFIYEQCNDEWLHMFMHEYEESTLNIRSLVDIARIAELEKERDELDKQCGEFQDGFFSYMAHCDHLQIEVDNLKKKLINLTTPDSNKKSGGDA